MIRIELTDNQRAQMTGLIGQLNTTRTVAEAFVGYFAKELGVNLQLYQFNADTMAFDPVGGDAPPTGQAMQEEAVVESYKTPPAVSKHATQAAENNGKIEAI